MSRPPQEEDKPCGWKDAVSIYVLGESRRRGLHCPGTPPGGGCFQCELELSRAVESLETVAESAVTTLPSGARERFLTAFDKERLAQKKKPDSSILYKKSGVLISRSDAIPWQPVGIPGIWAKALFADVEQHCVTSLVRVDPRAQYPSHRHGGPEEIFPSKWRHHDRRKTLGNPETIAMRRSRKRPRRKLQQLSLHVYFASV